jgi:hypothetical protein
MNVLIVIANLETNMEATYSFKWGYYIHVYDGGYPTDNVIKSIKWENLTFEMFCKYKWYFEYRYALLRVEHPKVLIRRDQFKRDLNEIEKSDLLRNKIIGKKRTITKYKNKLAVYVQKWNSLFPISDDEPYKKAILKIDRLENELAELLKQ